MTEQTNTFGKYEILGELGRGGFATVYRVKDTTLGRQVALKLLDPSRTWEPGFVERFYQEARIAAQLKHPNIITVYEIDEIDGQLFIAMELADQGTLAEPLEGKGRLSPEEATELLTPIADALDYAHAQGIIHRDIKPANFMLDLNRDGSVRPILSDFGLVKALSHSTELTRSGTVLGTPKYMAPEQIDPDLQHLLGPATDIYALGIVVFQMLTGQVPFEGNSTQVSYAHIHKQPPSPTELRSDLSPAISDAILKALDKKPEDRFSTATAFVQALEEQVEPDEFVEKPPDTAPPLALLPTKPDDSEAVPTPTESEEKQVVQREKKGRSSLKWPAITAAIIVLAGILYIVWNLAQPRILSVGAHNWAPNATEPFSFHWSTQNATNIDVIPKVEGMEVSEDRAFFANGIAKPMDFTIIAKNRLGQDNWRVSVQVAEPIPVKCGDAAEELSSLSRSSECTDVIEKASEYINAGCTGTHLFHSRGDCYGDENLFELALQDFATAIEFDPTDPWNYIYRAEVYEQMGDPRLQLADLNQSVSVAPGDPQTYFHRAEYYEQKGDIQSALDDVMQALELHPTDNEYYDKFLELTDGFQIDQARQAKVDAWQEDSAASQASDTTTPDANAELGIQENPIIMTFVPLGDTQKIIVNADAIAEMLQKETGLAINATVGADFAAVREAMGAGQAHIGWLNTFNYVLANEKYSVDAVLVTERFGSTSYKGQFNVLADSGIESLEDLKGKVMCWVETNSTTGYIIPRIMLRANGIDPDKDFANQIEVGTHNDVITQIYNGECDVGTTYADARSSVEEDLPDVKDKVAVLAVTSDIPNDSVSFIKDFPDERRQAIVEALLAYAATEEGQEVLNNLYSITGLQPSSDSFYDAFRADLSRAGMVIEELAE